MSFISFLKLLIAVFILGIVSGWLCNDIYSGYKEGLRVRNDTVNYMEQMGFGYQQVNSDSASLRRSVHRQNNY